MGILTLDWCGYADDLLLVFDDIESLRQGIEILDETFRSYRLSINSSTINTIMESTLQLLDCLEEKNYRYLGCEIKFDEPTTGITELNLQAEVAECKLYSLSRSKMSGKINQRHKQQC